MKNYSNIVIVAESSFIKELQYSSKRRELAVKLSSGKIYVYSGVGPKTFTAFANAESFGEFYNENIKGIYESQELVRSA